MHTQGKDKKRKGPHILVVDVPEVVHALGGVIATADGLIPVLVVPPEHSAALPYTPFRARSRPSAGRVPATVDAL